MTFQFLISHSSFLISHFSFLIFHFPPEENNTLNYVEWVAAATDMPPTEMLPPPNDENKSLWLRMALAMAWYEGRIQPADMVRAGIDEEQDGWNMALCAE